MTSSFITINQPGFSQSNKPLWQRSMRLSMFTFIGAVITLAIFWIMSELVSSDTGPSEPIAATPIIDILMNDDESPLETNTRQLPEPPKMMEKPPQQLPDVEELSESDAMNGFGDGFQIAAPNVSTEANTSFNMNSGGDARPIVRISPRYPITAARDGIEGWVRLSFTINETGGVEDVTVIDAEPARVFNREATRALRKWKYKPKSVDGKAVKQPGMSVELTFTLEGQNAQ